MAKNLKNIFVEGLEVVEFNPPETAFTGRQCEHEKENTVDSELSTKVDSTEFEPAVENGEDTRPKDDDEADSVKQSTSEKASEESNQVSSETKKLTNSENTEMQTQNVEATTNGDNVQVSNVEANEGTNAVPSETGAAEQKMESENGHGEQSDDLQAERKAALRKENDKNWNEFDTVRQEAQNKTQ